MTISTIKIIKFLEHSDWELLGLKMGVKPACHTQNLSKTVQKDKGKTKKGTKFSQNRGYLHRRP
jgi:hypothetical protein